MGRGKFLQREQGQRKFRDRFSLASWYEMADKDRPTHSAFDCKACAMIPEFELMKSNALFITTEKDKLTPARIVIRTVNERTPRVRTPQVSAAARRKIEQNFLKKMRDESVQAHTTALYSSNLSMNKYAKLRIRQSCTYVRHRAKSHIGPLRSYNFDRQCVADYLRKLSPNSKQLGKKMARRWAQLSRKAGPMLEKNREQVRI